MYSNEKIKKLCRVSLVALVVGLGITMVSPAQALLPPGSAEATGPVPMNQKAAPSGNTAEIPDEIALFDEQMDIPTPGEGMITPGGAQGDTPQDAPAQTVR